MSANPQDTADLVTFTEEILNGKLHFLCSVRAELTEFFQAQTSDEIGSSFWIKKKTSKSFSYSSRMSILLSNFNATLSLL